MHQNSKAARRYAKALLSFAVEQDELENVASDMELIANTCKSSRELIALLKSPVIKTEKKRDVINKVFSGKIGSITLKFLDVMTRQNREDILAEIAMVFRSVYRDHKGIVKAEIVTAIPLSEESRAKAIEIITKLYDKIELSEKVDEEMIGGFIIRVGDKQYDESVSRKLLSLRREFAKNPYISEL
jgi:F-type H+-transporting ATPase subunit delta